jgi:hypothetical protein
MLSSLINEKNVTYFTTYQDAYHLSDLTGNVLLVIYIWQDPRVQITERLAFNMFDAIA